METRLTMLFGAVLGMGVALTLSRLFADVLGHTPPPGWPSAPLSG